MPKLTPGYATGHVLKIIDFPVKLLCKIGKSVLASFTFFKFFQYSTIQLLVNIPTQGEFGFLTKMNYFRALLNCATIHGDTKPSTTNYNHPQLAIILQPPPMNHQLFHYYRLQPRTLLKNAPFQNYFFNDLA